MNGTKTKQKRKEEKMKIAKLLAAAFCAAACATSAMFAFAEDDDIMASASTPMKIADPVNPKKGMLFKGYNIKMQFGGKFHELPSMLQNVPTVKTTVVDSERFSYGNFKDVEISQGVWEGWLKCKRSANCTFLFQQPNYNGAGYILFVNGKRVISGWDQHSALVDMKAGYNHFKLIAQRAHDAPVSIKMKATGSTADPKPVTPKDLWHDSKPDEGDMF